MPDRAPPHWMLIAVLFSTHPLTPAQATLLHRVAYELYRRDEADGPLLGEVVRGRVVNLRRDLLLGTIGGPAFEAQIETERGASVVRFLLTRQGIEAMAESQPRSTLN